MDHLPPRSVIVLDNASYHNSVTEETKTPNMNTRKQDMRDWLTQQGVHFDEKDTKKILYELIKNNKPSKKYVTDDLARRAGHVVLRTPPRQCELNAIELIWAMVKPRVARQNTAMTLKEVLKTTKDVISNISQQEWQKVVEHTKKLKNNTGKQMD